MVAGSVRAVRGKSELHRAGCLAKVRETRDTGSTVQIGAPGNRCESNRNQTGRGNVNRLKRAILPAAISDPTVIRLLAEVESREQS
jgi:hypothetical protein